MSIRFPLLADTFLQTTFGTALTVRYPVTMAGWVKFKTDTGVINTCVTGLTSSGGNHKIQRLATDGIRYQFDCVSTDVLITSTITDAEDVWVFVAITRTSDSLGYLYVKEAGGTKDYQQSLTLSGAWSTDEIVGAAFGSNDILLAGGKGDYQRDLMLADWGFWPSALSEANLDLLAGGDSPATIAGITHHWFIDNVTDSLVDQIGTDDLDYYDTLTATINTGTYPPVYDADHPPVTPVNPTYTLTFNLKNVTDGSLWANKTGVQYILLDGTDADDIAIVTGGRGTAETTDANGDMVIDAPTGYITNDRIIMLAFKPALSDIKSDTTEYAVGPESVV